MQRYKDYSKRPKLLQYFLFISYTVVPTRGTPQGSRNHNNLYLCRVGRENEVLLTRRREDEKYKDGKGQEERQEGA